MDRCGLFVDAGYLYAEGGKLCARSPSRQHSRLDAEGFKDHFVAVAAEACGLPMLRLYWYDAAKNATPNSDQLEIANLSDVKLRLGRLTRNVQKGVDALIYHDLMTLARERAICEAFLLSGDEDLREGVKSAQDMGVRVTLAVIATRDGSRNYSPTLANEADRVLEFRRADLAAYISRRATAIENSGGEGMESHYLTFDGVGEGARQFAEAWLARITEVEATALVRDEPRIPTPLDAELLAAVENHIGTSIRTHESERRAARRAFWQRVRQSREEGASAPC